MDNLTENLYTAALCVEAQGRLTLLFLDYRRKNPTAVGFAAGGLGRGLPSGFGPQGGAVGVCGAKQGGAVGLRG